SGGRPFADSRGGNRVPLRSSGILHPSGSAYFTRLLVPLSALLTARGALRLRAHNLRALRRDLAVASAKAGPPLALARGRRFASLPSGPSLGAAGAYSIAGNSIVN